VSLEIRRVKRQEEYWGVENIQREAWGFPDIGIVPDNMLMAVQRNGGLVLGAFDRSPDDERERLVGFALGFVGLVQNGMLRHWSHMVAVLPSYQNRNVGYRLKLAQRERVLAQGLEHILWTFDPLESRNAYLNFHKLGAVCNVYRREEYGRMRDELNVSLPSDRFEVHWYIVSRHVAERLNGSASQIGISALLDLGVPLVNGFGDTGKPCLGPVVWPEESEQVMIQIPAHFQALKAADLETARDWRFHTRELFETAFGLGYTVVDLLHEDGRSCYVLRKDWGPNED